jgi:hypothetical protein
MTAIFALSVLTAISLCWFFAARALYRRTGDMLYPVGAGLFYLWTFFGAWWFIGDTLSGYEGFRIGLGYYYYMERMFPFELNSDYVKGLVGYSIFSLGLLGVLWWSRLRTVVADPVPIRLDHRVLLLLGGVCIGVSMLLVWPDIRAAWQEGVSFYSMIRSHPGRWYAVHGIANEAATCCLLFGYAVRLASSHPRALFIDDGRRWHLVAYPIALLSLGLYFSLIGDRHALFTGCLLALLYLFGRIGRGAWRRSGLLIGVTVSCLWLGGWLRGFSPQELKTMEKVQMDEGPFRVPAIAHVPRHPQGLVARAGNSMLSNEFFAAHFSMYAVFAKRIPVEPFISFRYLAGSLVPSFIKPERPPTAYEHYASSGGFDERTGYTIHHATAWYLNFGWAGLIIGGLFLGGIWGGLYRLRMSSVGKRYTAWVALLPFLFVSFLPQLLRTGPEGYRALLVEGFGVPLAVLLLAAASARSKGNVAADKNAS